MKTSTTIIHRIGLSLALTLGPWTLGLHAQPGSQDTNFNAGAISGHWGYSVAVQSDGKVVAAGTFGVMRFLDGGSVDPAFQPLSPAALPFAGAGSRLGAVRLQHDGRIVVTGSFTNSVGAPLPGLMRLHANGSIDPSFTLDPRVHPAGRILALQPDGKVVTSGFFAGAGDIEYSGLVRLRSDGSFDDSFNARWFDSSADFYSLALTPEGKIYSGTFSDIFRVNRDGSFDAAFIPDVYLGPIGAIAEQWDGKVLIGHYGDGPGYSSMQRFLANGVADPGWMVPAIDGGDHVIYAILPQPDGKVLFGGNTIYGINGIPISGLARLHPDGSVDSSFFIDPDLHSYSVEEMALAPDGKIIVAGMNLNVPAGYTAGPGVWRLNNDAGPRGIEFTAASYVAREGDGWVTISVRRTTGTDKLAIVAYDVRPGTATRWRDYFGGDGILVFRRGETLKRIRLYVVRDHKTEDFETVRLALVRVRGGSLGPQRHATLTILDH